MIFEWWTSHGEKLNKGPNYSQLPSMHSFRGGGLQVGYTDTVALCITNEVKYVHYDIFTLICALAQVANAVYL